MILYGTQNERVVSNPFHLWVMIICIKSYFRPYLLHNIPLVVKSSSAFKSLKLPLYSKMAAERRLLRFLTIRIGSWMHFDSKTFPPLKYEVCVIFLFLLNRGFNFFFWKILNKWNCFSIKENCYDTKSKIEENHSITSYVKENACKTVHLTN